MENINLASLPSALRASVRETLEEVYREIQWKAWEHGVPLDGAGEWKLPAHWDPANQAGSWCAASGQHHHRNIREEDGPLGPVTYCPGCRKYLVD